MLTSLSAQMGHNYFCFYFSSRRLYVYEFEQSCRLQVVN